MNQEQQDNSSKSILARSCDPEISRQFSEIAPRLLGNPEYIYATDDKDFTEKLSSRKWSIIFFAPGACRFSAAALPIPGGNSDTQGWTLEQYRELVKKHQGEDIPIVESTEESKVIPLLKEALQSA